MDHKFVVALSPTIRAPVGDDEEVLSLVAAFVFQKIGYVLSKKLSRHVLITLTQ
jgi:hypothetical protein